AARSRCAPLAGRVGREFIGIDRWCQRPLIESGARHVRMTDHLRVTDAIDWRCGDVREVERFRFLSAAMRKLQILERLCRTRTLGFGNVHTQVDACDAAL